MRARAIVRLRDGVLDPQGEAVRRALGDLGYAGVASVRQGKAFEIVLEADDAAAARSTVEAMCAALLANPVTEDFDVEIVSEPGA